MATLKKIPELTHLEKIFWPEEKYTKGDVIAYYNEMYKHIGKYLKDRAESLLRSPDGIKGESFFHKDAGGDAPEWVTTYESWSESTNKNVNYIVCNDKSTLLYMANLGCIEINPWNSRIKYPDEPDYLIIDIDPSKKSSFEQVIETAQAVKQVLDKAGAESYCKTSGATGIHIYVPLGAKYNYEHAKNFAHLIATKTHELLPDITSLERSLAKRGADKIYLDFLQNRKGQTVCSVYSLRPKPGAPVSTPLEWQEVKSGVHPTDFNIKNTLKRLEKKGDLFAGVLGKGIDLRKCLKNIEA